MYCEKCGKEIREDEKFCGRCGNPLETINISRNQRTEKNKKMKSIVWKAVPLIVICVVVFSFIHSNGKKSVEDVAMAACKAMKEKDVKKYYQLLSEPYLEYMVGPNGWYDDAEEFQEEMREDAEDWFDNIERKCGEDYKAEYKVGSVEEIENEELEQLRWKLSNDYDYEEQEIKEAAIVTIIIKAYGAEGGGSWKVKESCVKIGNAWYIHAPGFD